MAWHTVQRIADASKPEDLFTGQGQDHPSVLDDYKSHLDDCWTAELTRLNAGYQFKDASGGYLYRTRPTPLPTLREALRRIPQRMGVLLDLKSADTHALVPAVAKTLDALQSEGRPEWERVRFYSTEMPNLDLLASYPQARLFEDRDTIRTRLVTSRLTGECLNPPGAGTWTLFHLFAPGKVCSP
ncbi:hypothetical protein GCM10010302_32480 [Streptomyces polychromogenes]|uniref:Uncharacterized protein n=1 Tax=Streptomyces polychromogenes TaxID=67342 RepID=A0ABP3F504_9ACTN